MLLSGGIVHVLTPINTIAIHSHLSNNQLTHRTKYTFPDSVDTSWCNWLMSSRILCNTQNPYGTAILRAVGSGYETNYIVTIYLVFKMPYA